MSYNANEDSDRRHMERIQSMVDELRRTFDYGFCSEEAQNKARQIISSLGDI